MPRRSFSCLIAGFLLVTTVGSFIPTSWAAEPQAAPETTPAKAPLTLEQLKADFAKADAERVATKADTQERGTAAEKARQAATDTAWAAFDAKNFAEASSWFDRASVLKKEANAARRAYWEHSLATDIPAGEAQMEGRFKEWADAAAKSDNPDQKKLLLSAIGMLKRNRFTMRYNAVSMLEQLAREGHDDAAWLRYEQEELRIRRAEMADLVEIKAPQDEIDKKNAEIAKALEGVAWAQEEQGMLVEAEKNNLAAYQQRRALPETLTDRDLGSALEALGYFHLFYSGDLDKAKGYYQEALVELNKNTAMRLKDWANDTYYTPERKAAMSEKERTEYETQHAEFKTILLAGAAISKANYLASLSYTARKLGNYREAIDLANRDRAVADELPTSNEPWYVMARGNIRSRALSELTVLHSATGEMELALKELDEGAQLKREMGDNNSAAQQLLQAGQLLYDQGKYAEAKPYIEQANRIFVSAQSMDGVVNTNSALALVARDSGQLDEANLKATAALELARKNGVASSITTSLRNLASIKLLQNQPADAGKLLDEAQTLDARNISVTDKIATLNLQGQLLEASAKNEEAVGKYREAITLLEGVRSTAPSEANFSNVKANYRIYERLVRLLVKMGRGEEAFDYLNRAKSKQLQDALSLSSVQSKNPVLRAKMDSANALDAQLRTIIGQLQSELAKPKEEQNLTKIQNLQVVRAQTQGEFFSVLDDIKKSNAKFDVRVEPADVKAIQKRIPTNTILIQYAPLGNEMYIFLFTRTNLKIIQTSVNPEKVWELVKQVRPQLARDNDRQRGARLATAPVAPTPQVPAGDSLENNLTSLYDLLIKPIEGDIADKSTLAFIPTQWLYYLPMQVLTQKQNGQLHYLIEDKNVVYLATTGQISKAMLPHEEGDLGNGLLAFGDPVGANLPAAKVEVQTIGKVFPDSTIYAGAEVVKTAVMADKNWEHRILHFATHGILNPNAPDQSYILLSPGQTPTDSELTVGEIQGLPLDKVDVVTLSACETALGESEPGREVMTLAGAFDRAGAYSIVASLWSVADDSTKDLMVEFYTQLAAGKNKAEAMRAAQLKVLHSPDFKQPFYWAPFILMGDWR